MQRKMILGAGVFAAVICTNALAGPKSAAGDEPQTIEIHSKKFEYMPSEVTLKKGETYKLHLTSDDVPHSLRIKSLGLNGLMKPNEFTDVLFTPEQTGDYMADCGVYCGVGHKKMAMTVHVVDK